MSRHTGTSVRQVPAEATADPEPQGFFWRLWSKICSLFGIRRRRLPEVFEPEVEIGGAYAEDPLRPGGFPGLPVHIVFRPFNRVSELGKRGYSSLIHVQTGTVAFAAHNQDPYDHEGMPEVYLAGEVVTRSRLRRADRCVVVELAERPGSFEFQMSTSLPGVSATEEDVAVARFTYRIHLVDPHQFLRSASRWPTVEGRRELINTISRVIREEVGAVFHDGRIQVWSSPKVADVAERLFASLDRKLKEWGLSLGESFTAQRWYPQRLTEMVLEFKAAERRLLELLGVERDVALAELGLGLGDRMVIRSESEKRGAGAGLFMAARKSKELFIEWLKSEEASEAAGLLEELYSGKFAHREVALTENVLLSAFRHPVLGLGEWGDAELDLAASSEYLELEPHLESQIA